MSVPAPLAGVNIYVGTLKGRYHPSDPRREWRIEDPAQQAVDRELHQDRQQNMKSVTAGRIFLRAAWQSCRKDPWGHVLYLARKARFFWQPNVGARHGQRIGQPVLAWVSEGFYWLCLLAAAPVVIMGRHLDRRAILPALLLAWTFLAHVLVGEAEPRYHFALVKGAAGAFRLLLG